MYSRFVREVLQLGHGRLHAKRQLVGGDAGVDLDVAGREAALAVEVAQGVQPRPLGAAADAAGAGKVQHGVTAAAERDPAIGRGQEPARPVGRASRDAGLAGLRRQHDVAGKIRGLAAQPVGHPRAHRRPAEHRDAAVHQQLAGVMVGHVRVHRTHHADVVGARSHVGDEVGELDAGLPIRLELARARPDLGDLLEVVNQIVLHRRGQSPGLATCASRAWDRTGRAGWGRRP